MTCTRRHVLVTGASTGIGRATALALAQSGHHVFAGMHKESERQSLNDRSASEKGEITTLLLDVTDAEQREAAAEVIRAHTGENGLNGLVNNAGIGVAQPLELISPDDLRRQLEVNVIAQLGVTQALLPMLRQAQGRIVVIGSIGDRITMPFAGPLTASKRAVAAIADTLRQELTPWGVSVVLVEPASIHTEAADKLECDNKRTLEQFSPQGRELYGAVYERMTAAALKQERAGSPPEVVGDLISAIMVARKPRVRYLVGKNARLLALLAAVAPTAVLDALRRKILKLDAPGSKIQSAQAKTVA